MQENKFLETSVLICAASYFEDHSTIAYRTFKEGHFIICNVVLGEVNRIYDRRIKIYNDLRKIKSSPRRQIWQIIEEIINRNHIDNVNDRGMIEQTFSKILDSLMVKKSDILSANKWLDFELETNVVFNRMKNKLCDIENSFKDVSYYLKHVIPKYNNQTHQNLFREFRKIVSFEKKHINDLWILTNAAVHTYKNQLFISFISNDKIHLNNIKKIYSIIDATYPIVIEEERGLTIIPLSVLAS